ncbi:BREX-1 system adenine-specific DNA-methyltransferase PglX [Olleya namhaensis]|uniref:site-specific DNA-methyltransferase (adenine-specific) n=1 Tax=Olleya namhaensis TaxID=1144750 RepID=A0A1I3MSX4_9FLAO|nr:BREX-1 system adenine-specific DNA-methyltransferase PglX [Olleya namhaensis]SFI99900.1 Type II restriction/modification system, DNA methylase subunit YeeA [Olleya namhaensis]
MNTNQLKRFAQDARIKLIDQIGAKLEKVLTTDSVELREKAGHLQKLQQAINKTSKADVIDTVAYTWFNRFVALRFMDVNGYQPIGVSIVSPTEGGTLPVILQEAKQGNIAEELPVQHQRIYDLLDGKIPSTDAQNEAYSNLLVGACNHLSETLPFLFEKIEDYTELLLPDDLISSFSIIEDIKVGMQPEDCNEVEILGWLYQFYISALNEKLISSKKKYAKNELAPASQLFTPKWIVQYMVDNTLGQVWSEIRPDSKVMDTLEFYIKPTYTEQAQKRKPKSIEDVTFFEPCVGSGHILSYAFDVFYKIYEEEGYNPSEIPKLIITKNLFGVDIDRRAAQIASFVLIMKGREKQRRFLRTVAKEHIEPNISFYQDFEFDNKFHNATALGSLIEINPKDVEKFKIEQNSLFAERQKEVFKLYKLLGKRYDCVVTNPPYITSSRMEGSLKQYVEANFPETKSDLFATFILRCLELCDGDGLTGYMTPFVWMFISSYEKLRGEIITKHFINNLIQLEYSGFDGATVPICTFTLRNKHLDAQSSFISLEKFKGSQNQGPKSLEAINNRSCGWFYNSNPKRFKKIDGDLLGYWLNDIQIESLQIDKTLDDLGKTRRGLQPGDTPMFVRAWHEIEFEKLFIAESNSTEKMANKKWALLNSGGKFRKWYGNFDSVVNWGNNGYDIKSYGKGIIPSEHLYFTKAIVWNKITSGRMGFRLQPFNIIPGDASPGFFPNDYNDINTILGFLNTKVTKPLLKLFAPTLNAQVGDLKKIPLKLTKENSIPLLVKSIIGTSKFEWHSRETSWGFNKIELISLQGQDLEEAYNNFCQSWKSKFFEVHKNEEELNKQFIDVYGLQDELTPEVPLEDITILKEETSIKDGNLVFRESEIMAQFISYAVGCMFGRYSLDKPGLILANQGETLEDYLKTVTLSAAEVSFLPDDDNIIPILDNEWFEDDIVGRFYAFLKATFGKPNFDKNLAFVEDAVGDIRKYFLKSFYNDHWKRYKKRPIYWLFSSPSGAFNALIYMHRYTPDTLNTMLNGYVKDYQEKLKAQNQQLDHVKNVGTDREKVSAEKEQARINKILLELQEYDRELFKIATERIAIDLDDGVLVNYNKFGKVIKEVKGLNDKKAKDKVRKFDWIDVTEIQ